jgi:alpha-glucosidase
VRPTRWWQTGVVYQVYPRSFGDSDGDGIGDLEGIRRHLDYLAWLGVDAVWISPFYRSPMADFGYDVADHIDVDPLFGDLAAFDRLLADAHARGLRVIVDYVPNHTSDRHPWFVESRSSKDSPKRDWYTWRDPKPDGSPPNNWISVFGGSSWAWDEATGQFYLHSFLAEQPDLDWRNAAVHDAMFDVARFWLDRGVDGFRIDAAQFIGKDHLVRDNPPNPHPERTAHMGAWSRQLHLYDQGHPDLHNVYRGFRGLVDSYTNDRVTIGELHHEEYAEWAAFYGRDLDELHVPFNFHLLLAPWDATAVRCVVDAIEAALPDGAWPNWVLGNHDQQRLASRIGLGQARLAMLLLLTLRGNPTIYYGDELGLRNLELRPDQIRDPWGLVEPGQGRDPARSPMPWDGTPGAGFTDGGVEPWLPFTPDAATANVEVQRGDPESLLNLTRDVIRLRREHPALVSGVHRTVDGVPDGTFCFLRSTEGEGERGPSVLVALNLTAEQRRLTLEFGPGRVLAATHPDRAGSTADSAALELRPDEGLVLEVATPVS